MEPSPGTSGVPTSIDIPPSRKPALVTGVQNVSDIFKLVVLSKTEMESMIILCHMMMLGSHHRYPRPLARRCHVHAAEGFTRRGHNNRDFNCIFLHAFMCPVFKASARGSPWPAADTALRQEIGAAACCLRLPLYGAAFSPRPTCKVCFLKTFLWKIWIGCLVFETFVNNLLRALTVAQGRQSRRQRRKRPTTPSTGCGHAAPTRSATRAPGAAFF